MLGHGTTSRNHEFKKDSMDEEATKTSKLILSSTGSLWQVAILGIESHLHFLQEPIMVKIDCNNILLSSGIDNTGGIKKYKGYVAHLKEGKIKNCD
jgi:hypothetical protein